MGKQSRYRLYVSDDLTQGKDIELDGQQVHYVRHVLRLKSGQTLRLFNGRHGEWVGSVRWLSKKDAQVNIDHQLRPQIHEPGVKLVFAPLQKGRMDILIEKAVELGVAALQPVMTQYTQKTTIQKDRLIRQVQEAAEQSERLTCPKVLDLCSLSKYLSSCRQTLLFADENRQGLWIHEVLKNHKDDLNSLAVLIGPAGGFSDDERDMIARYPCHHVVCLSAHVLRSETAVIAALCAVNFAKKS